jgi:hypothetical protein
MFVPGLLLQYSVPVLLHYRSKSVLGVLNVPPRLDDAPQLEFGPKRAGIVGVAGAVAAVLSLLFL